MATPCQLKTPQRTARKLPPVETVLVGRFKGEQVTATVVEAPQFREGKGIRVGDNVFKSLSAAAEAVTHRCTNGWLFWKW